MILSTERLQLRVLQLDDAAFYLRLVNDPSFINNIRDKGIRSIEDAKACIQTEHIDRQKEKGFSLYGVEKKDDQQLIGLCGFVKRDELPEIDVGYAFLPEFTGQAYAKEALTSLLPYAKNTLQLERLLAITSPSNTNSIKLLEKVGFNFQEMIDWKNKEALNLYAINL